MMTYTAYEPKTLEEWAIDEKNCQYFEEQMSSYLQMYDHLFHTQSQKRYFQTFIQGLFSNLDRKSLEPIALHFLGEKAVRSMQQFFSRSPLNDAGIMEFYQDVLADQLSMDGGMLSVDDSGFPKKGKHSVGVKRQYCGCLGKRENCQVGVFLAYASEKGYGLVDRELYIPQEWYQPSYEGLREEVHLPLEKTFSTKNQIAKEMLNKALASGKFQVQWIGCDAAYGNDHEFLDSLELPEGVWYFAATNSKEQVFLEYPEMEYPTGKRGRPRKHPILSAAPVSVSKIAEDDEFPWETVTLTEGAKGPIEAERKIVRCYASRKDGNRNYVLPGPAI